MTDDTLVNVAMIVVTGSVIAFTTLIVIIAGLKLGGALDEEDD